ncbi:hypothetical protein CWM47_22105 [Spirosoma pollinicola]|uniref:Uncharacterized protein n=1 Tax=Spirosoma pollinicola TaxID=2057025 RepID=A0A2K8Z347_9BACT|nr:hypothetical protein CWM47_22105 [Spirosoma pollinicola]
MVCFVIPTKDRAAGAGIFGEGEVFHFSEDPRSGGPVLRRDDKIAKSTVTLAWPRLIQPLTIKNE